MENVGQELLQCIKSMEKIVLENSNQELTAKYFSFWIDSPGVFEEPYEKVLPIIQSLTDAGWEEDKVERSYKVSRTYKHPEIDSTNTITVRHKATKEDKLQGLKEQQEELQAQILKLQSEGEAV